MGTNRYISLFIAGAAVIAMTGCGKKATEGPDNTPTARSIVLRDSAFTSDDLLSFFFLLSPYDGTTGLMSVNTSVGRVTACNGSIVSDSNNRAGALFFTEVFDSTLVAEFYLRADSLCHTNFIAFLGKDRGSGKNTLWHVGIGFDATDSVKYVYGDSVGASTGTSLNVSPIQLNHWYKCSVEFTFADTTAVFYLDDVKMGEVRFSIIGYQSLGYNFFAVYRNGLGADGPVPYYLNDLTIYKK
jgi:hypothetical protein